MVHDLTKDNHTPCIPNVDGKDTDKRCNDSHLAHLLPQLERRAVKWRDIGTHLGFLRDELNIIEGKPTLHQGAPKSWLRTMLEEWLEWTPRDKRGSKSYATLNCLKNALREAGLGRSAEELTLQPEHLEVGGSTQ